MFTPSGPAGIFAFYLPPGQKIGYAFLNEFVNVGGTVDIIVLFPYQKAYSVLS